MEGAEDSPPAAADAHDGAPDADGAPNAAPEKREKHSKHKKEKKKHRHREKERQRERAAGEPASPLAAAASPPAAAAQEGAPIESPAAVPAPDAEEGELPAEEGELPQASPPGEKAADERGSDRRHSRSRSRSKERHKQQHERPLRSRSRSRSRPRHSRSQSRSRLRHADRHRSRSPRRRDDRPPLPPRGYDRSELDRRRGFDDRRVRDDRRRPYEERDRAGGRRGGYGGRRSRSRSRSRSRQRGSRSRSRSHSRDRKRHRSEDHQEQQQQEEEEEEEFQRRVAAALEGGEGDDEDRLIEERRRRRQEILARHRSQQQLSEAASAPTAAALRHAASDAAFRSGSAAASAPPSGAPSPRREGGGEDGGDEAELSDGEEAVVAALGLGEGGAADIFAHDAGPAPRPDSGAGGAPPPPSGIGEGLDTELGRRLEARDHAAPPPEPADMFGDDADDIFASTPADARGAAEGAAAQGGGGEGGGAAPAPAPAAAKKGLLDNYDDAEGYYNFQVGEIIGGHFEVYAAHGKGVFSSVLRARDTSRRDPDTGAHPEVAIKVIRANDTMYKAGQVEKVILRKLSEADPEGRRHCVRMLSSFEYRSHLCLVFESMDMNLRELTKRYGRGIGLSISAVRIYAQQLLVGLHHLRNCGVLHADIKPDNILVNSRRTVVKLCDFGSAMFSGDNEITPYLVSRFYRAPEVILGLPYDHPMDMWSIGCVLYELLTGQILFPGRTNNEMLKLMMDAKGPFPKKMLRKAEFAFKHFEGDAAMSFALLEEDPVTKRPVRRLIPNPTVKRDFSALLAGQAPDRRKLVQLADLLERMIALDPDRRITPKEALRHPFVKEAPAAHK